MDHEVSKWLTNEAHDEVAMRIGIGTYALFWEWNERNPSPMTIEGMIDRARELSCDVFQICDDPQLDAYSDEDLVGLAHFATSRGIELELGTRGTGLEHLGQFIHKADLIGAKTLRSMVLRDEVTDGIESVVDRLCGLVPALEARDVTLALETYEQISTDNLVEVCRRVGSPRIGICLDPANCVSALEHPTDVIAKAGPYVTNLHVKDFGFSRNEGWVGFLFAGSPLGEGLLDLDLELDVVYRDGRDVSAIVEHWVPWQGSIDASVAMERQWTELTLAALRERRTA